MSFMPCSPGVLVLPLSAGSRQTTISDATPGADGPQPSIASRQTTIPDPTPLLAPGEAPPAGPLLVFRRTSLDAYNGALGIAPVADPASPRFVPALRCERVHMAAGRGVCLTADRGVFTSYRAVLFDRTFNPLAELPLVGAPSRLQVAPDGRWAATPPCSSPGIPTRPLGSPPGPRS